MYSQTYILFASISSAGQLDAVTNLTNQSLVHVIHLTWDAPFSLDITGVDPDIWYRVDTAVGNISLNTLFISRVVNIPEFNFTMDGHNGANTSVIYEFQVTPINGAGNGKTSASVTGYFSGRELLMILHENLPCTVSSRKYAPIEQTPSPSLTPK